MAQKGLQEFGSRGVSRRVGASWIGSLRTAATW